MSRTTNSRAAPYVEPVGGGAGCVWRRGRPSGGVANPRRTVVVRREYPARRAVYRSSRFHFFRTHATAPLTCGAIAQEPAR